MCVCVCRRRTWKTPPPLCSWLDHSACVVGLLRRTGCRWASRTASPLNWSSTQQKCNCRRMLKVSNLLQRPSSRDELLCLVSLSLATLASERFWSSGFGAFRISRSLGADTWTSLCRSRTASAERFSSRRAQLKRAAQDFSITWAV